MSKILLLLMSVFFLASGMLHADTDVANWIEWTFSVRNGNEAIITGIPCETQGELKIPSVLYSSSGSYWWTRQVTGIGNGAFKDCRGLTSATIPYRVTIIGAEAFKDCSGLVSVQIPRSVTTIGAEAFYGCCCLTSVTITEGVTQINSGSFSGCDKLANVMIPMGVTSVGDFSFLKCGDLSNIAIPASVTNIGNSTFYGCSNLVTITFHGDAPHVGKQSFDGVSCECVAYVQYGTKGWTVGYDGKWNGLVLQYVMPEIYNPTAEQISNIFVSVGANDLKLAQRIRSETEYTNFCNWATRVMPATGDSIAAGVDAVITSPNAWLSYALDVPKLIETLPREADLRIEKLDPDENKKFNFEISIIGLDVGGGATEENLKQVFKLEGSDVLDHGKFNTTNIDVVFDAPKNGRIKFTAGPSAKNSDAKTFFMKVKMTP